LDKNSQPFGKKCQKISGGFFTHIVVFTLCSVIRVPYRAFATELYFNKSSVFVYVVVSAVSNVSCNFDDVDVCGYKDLSDAGINWSQIHSQSMTVSYSIYQSCMCDHSSIENHASK